jgi:hypothetical protein
MGRGQVQKPLLDRLGQGPGLSLVKRAANRRYGPACGLTSRLGDRGLSDAISLPDVVGRALSFGCVRKLGHNVSTFLHPLAPPALPGFHATMGALTPGRPALRLTHEHRLDRRPGLPVFRHRIFRSFRLQPPVVVPERFWGSVLPGLPYHGSRGCSLPRAIASIGLRLSLAGSPRRPAESSSRALRTNRSPPVALHPASRRRSYLRLQSARTLWQGLAPR